MNDRVQNPQRERSLEAHPLPEGGCACGRVRYRVEASPLIVHACHCRACQRQTGAAYAINALIEDDSVVLESGELVELRVPTQSGAGQTIARCAHCQVAVWSRYHVVPQLGDRIYFLRVGTLDDPNVFAPDVHIHTTSKSKHVMLPPDTRRFEGYYETKCEWSASSLARVATLAARVRTS